MSELARDAEWRRLDTRMLLVHPVNEVIRFLPILLGAFFLGTRQQGGDVWHYLGVLIPIGLGLLRFLTSRFRITGTQIELRRGLVGRTVVTAPLDRVRTVELTARPIHRLLGLSRVEIGTGSAAHDRENRLVLDALGTAEARRLRADLLDRTGAATPEPVTDEQVLLRLDPAWVRYAPLTTSGLVIAAAAFAASSQFLSRILIDTVDSTRLEQRVRSLPIELAVGVGLLSLVVVVSALAMGGYLLGNWGFLLTRSSRTGTLHVRRGALTTRETSLDTARLRGVEVHEPLGLRLGGGARLTSIATGLGRRSPGASVLVPPAPRAVVLDVGDRMLGEAAPGPLRIELHDHGPAALRRRLIRGVLWPAALPVSLLLLTRYADWPWWPAALAALLPLAGLPLALDRYRRLGHALTPGYLVLRSGSLRGRRDALLRSGVIGWNLRQSWFQRRAGLVTLTVTTAAGQQGYHLPDVPEELAVGLADAAIPGLVDQFLA